MQHSRSRVCGLKTNSAILSTSQMIVQAHQEWLEQAAQTLSKQASTLSWHQTTAHLGLVDDANHQPNEKHIEHCVACQKSNEKVEISEDVIVTIPEVQKFTAALSIAGMTCAACILSINEGVQELRFLEDVSVSLLTNSATVTFAGPKDNIDQIVERIEDRGYGCHVENIVEVGGLRKTRRAGGKDSHDQNSRHVLRSLPTTGA